MTQPTLRSLSIPQQAEARERARDYIPRTPGIVTILEAVTAALREMGVIR